MACPAHPCLEAAANWRFSSGRTEWLAGLVPASHSVLPEENLQLAAASRHGCAGQAMMSWAMTRATNATAPRARQKVAPRHTRLQGQAARGCGAASRF